MGYRTMSTRTMKFEIEVTVPATTGENEVSTAINAALDEPPCDWGDWEVGAAIIVTVRRNSK